MQLNIIIGRRSNLSRNLGDKIINSVLISSANIELELNGLSLCNYESINIIFNQFQPATKLYKLDSPINYIDNAIKSTAIVLEYIVKHSLNIKKIIYTSSSSIYGNNVDCSEVDRPTPLSLHSSLKLANENLVKLFSEKNNIDYTITRIFNMYGGNDQFSIVSKIINAYKNSTPLSLINNGSAIRDYVHIDDVVKIYIELLSIRNAYYVNIGTGKGESVLSILEFLRVQGISIKTISTEREELKVSVSNLSFLNSLLGDIDFLKVKNFIVDTLSRK
jgi:nucleoside-diphosphate-sugar epimerase